MTTYRTGTHWGVIIVAEPTPESGSKLEQTGSNSELIAVVVNGDQALAERICALLNAYQPSDCPRVGEHNCNGEWRNHDRYEPSTHAPPAPQISPESAEIPSEVPVSTPDDRKAAEAIYGDGYKRAIGTLADVAQRTGSPAARWAADYLAADPDKLGPPIADSCTCTVAGPDPACVVHQGRRAKGPKPPPAGPGCICDGSGRTCPRHGAVL